ncbi:MAG: hypothetical protein V1838_03100 [Patescibacteria group bacterium]
MALLVFYDQNMARLDLYARIIGAEHEVIGCTDIFTALRFIAENDPQLVLAEWYEGDGPKLIKELHKLRINHPPVILIGELKDMTRFDEVKSRAHTHGACGFITRPFSTERFRQILKANLFRADEGTIKSNILKDFYGKEDDPILAIVRATPMYSLAEHIGGLGKLADILARNNALEREEIRQQLCYILNQWGSLSSAEQIVEACEYCNKKDEASSDPVMAVLCDLSCEILFGKQAVEGSK